MVQPEFFEWQQDFHTPPIPPRNPLRERNLNQGLPHRRQENRGEELADVPFPAARRFLGESPRELTDMQLNVFTAVHMARSPCDEDKALQTSTRSSLTDGFTQYSSYLEQGKSPALHGSNKKSAKQLEIEDVMARIQRNSEVSEPTRDVSAQDSTSLGKKREEEEARVEAWLGRRLVGTPSSLLESPPQSSTSLDFLPQVKVRYAFTTPPSTSSTAPTIGRRTYASPKPPLSPLNNGRDVYGNYIPTNTRDYSVTNSPPTSPALQPIQEEEAPRQNPMPHLRGGGGGGWWNSLGIGQPQIRKEPSSQLGTPGTGSSYCNTRIQMLKEKASDGGQNLFSNRSNVPDGGSQIVRGVGSVNAKTETRGKAAVEEDWSDASDCETFDIESLVPPTEQIQSSANPQFGSVQERQQGRSKEPSFPTPDHRAADDDFTYGRANFATTGDRLTPDTGPTADIRRGRHPTWDDLSPVNDFPNTSTGPESSRSDFSYGAREHKRWNRQPASGPPPTLALPPLPPKGTLPTNEARRSVVPLSPLQHRHELTSSVAESYEDEAWELQSLRFGESVSVTGRGPQGDPRRRTNETVLEEYQASQKRAQIQFRPLCQDIMTRYNTEMSSHERALQRNEISLEQYKMFLEWNVSNRENSLKHSAETSGYLILADEPNILDAIKDPDAYPIYYDLLHTTQPELWQRLEEQHQLTKGILPTGRTFRPSSLDQARYVAGKFARFLLAAPSDPDLKTHSTRKQKHTQSIRDAQSTRATSSIPQTWMDPMAVARFTGVQDDDAWRARPKKDKKKKDGDKDNGKTKMHLFIPPLNHHDTSRNSALTGTTAVNTTSHWTRTAAPVEHRYSAASIPASDAAALRRHSHMTAASAESMWPEGDSRGNWMDVKVPRLRGGGKPKKRRMQWFNASYTETLLFSR